jgi:hypothetical protein
MAQNCFVIHCARGIESIFRINHFESPFMIEILFFQLVESASEKCTSTIHLIYTHTHTHFYPISLHPTPRSLSCHIESNKFYFIFQAKFYCIAFSVFFAAAVCVCASLSICDFDRKMGLSNNFHFDFILCHLISEHFYASLCCWCYVFSAI